MLFQKEKIEVIAGHRGCLAAFPSEHLLLAVRGSCGRLSMDWFEPEKEARGCETDYRSILYLGETPLLRIQANGSPTCESMLAAGYGIPEDCREIRSVRAALDKPYAGLADALERVRPVLGLLQPGIYVLSYSDYYPTDGDGHFFWDVPESLTSFKATSEYYDSDKHRVLPLFPLLSLSCAERTKVRSSTGGELSAAPQGRGGASSCFGLFALGIYECPSGWAPPRLRLCTGGKNSAGPDHIASGAYLERGNPAYCLAGRKRDAGGGYHHPCAAKTL